MGMCVWGGACVRACAVYSNTGIMQKEEFLLIQWAINIGREG